MERDRESDTNQYGQGISRRNSGVRSKLQLQKTRAKFQNLVKRHFLQLVETGVEPNEAASLALVIAASPSAPPIYLNDLVPLLEASRIAAGAAAGGANRTNLHDGIGDEKGPDFKNVATRPSVSNYQPVETTPDATLSPSHVQITEAAAEAAFRFFNSLESLRSSFWPVPAAKTPAGTVANDDNGMNKNVNVNVNGNGTGDTDNHFESSPPRTSSPSQHRHHVSYGDKAPRGEIGAKLKRNSNRVYSTNATVNPTAASDPDLGSASASASALDSDGASGVDDVLLRFNAMDWHALSYVSSLVAALRTSAPAVPAAVFRGLSHAVALLQETPPTMLPLGMPRLLAVLLALLEDVEDFSLTASVCRLAVSLPALLRRLLVAHFARYPLALLRRVVSTLQQYMTLQLFGAQTITEGIRDAVQLLALLALANELRDDAHPPTHPPFSHRYRHHEASSCPAGLHSRNRLHPSASTQQAASRATQDPMFALFSRCGLSSDSRRDVGFLTANAAYVTRCLPSGRPPLPLPLPASAAGEDARTQAATARTSISPSKTSSTSHIRASRGKEAMKGTDPVYGVLPSSVADVNRNGHDTMIMTSHDHELFSHSSSSMLTSTAMSSSSVPSSSSPWTSGVSPVQRYDGDENGRSSALDSAGAAAGERSPDDEGIGNTYDGNTQGNRYSHDRHGDKVRRHGEEGRSGDLVFPSPERAATSYLHPYLSGRLHFSEFYNGAVNTEDFNLKEDFRRWNLPSEYPFSLCNFPFIFDAASKAKLLALECQIQQAIEIYDAVRKGMFGATPTAGGVGTSPGHVPVASTSSSSTVSTGGGGHSIPLPLRRPAAALLAPLLPQPPNLPPRRSLGSQLCYDSSLSPPRPQVQVSVSASQVDSLMSLRTGPPASGSGAGTGTAAVMNPVLPSSLPPSSPFLSPRSRALANQQRLPGAPLAPTNRGALLDLSSETRSGSSSSGTDGVHGKHMITSSQEVPPHFLLPLGSSTLSAPLEFYAPAPLPQVMAAAQAERDTAITTRPSLSSQPPAPHALLPSPIMPVASTLATSPDHHGPGSGSNETAASFSLLNLLLRGDVPVPAVSLPLPPIYAPPLTLDPVAPPGSSVAHEDPSSSSASVVSGAGLVIAGLGTGGDSWALPGRDTCPYLVFKVSRGPQLFREVLAQTRQAKGCDGIRRPLKVSFRGEDAVDEGGVQKELFGLLTRAMADPHEGVFECDAETRLCWTKRLPPRHAFSLAPPAAGTSGGRLVLDEAALRVLDERFELCGILMGLAIFNQHQLAFNFPKIFYRKLVHDPRRARRIRRVPVGSSEWAPSRDADLSCDSSSDRTSCDDVDDTETDGDGDSDSVIDNGIRLHGAACSSPFSSVEGKAGTETLDGNEGESADDAGDGGLSKIVSARRLSRTASSARLMSLQEATAAARSSTGGGCRLEDLADLAPDVASNLVKMLQFEGDVEDWGLVFQVDMEVDARLIYRGRPSTEDLLPTSESTSAATAATALLSTTNLPSPDARRDQSRSDPDFLGHWPLGVDNASSSSCFSRSPSSTRTSRRGSVAAVRGGALDSAVMSREVMYASPFAATTVSFLNSDPELSVWTTSTPVEVLYLEHSARRSVADKDNNAFNTNATVPASLGVASQGRSSASTSPSQHRLRNNTLAAAATHPPSLRQRLSQVFTSLTRRKGHGNGTPLQSRAASATGLPPEGSAPGLTPLRPPTDSDSADGGGGRRTGSLPSLPLGSGVEQVSTVLQRGREAPSSSSAAAAAAALSFRNHAISSCASGSRSMGRTSTGHIHHHQRRRQRSHCISSSPLDNPPRGNVTITVNLVRAGDRIPVTNANRDVYVYLYVRHFLEDTCDRQFEMFRRGFRRLCGPYLPARPPPVKSEEIPPASGHSSHSVSGAAHHVANLRVNLAIAGDPSVGSGYAGSDRITHGTTATGYHPSASSHDDDGRTRMEATPVLLSPRCSPVRPSFLFRSSSSLNQSSPPCDVMPPPLISAPSRSRLEQRLSAPTARHGSATTLHQDVSSEDPPYAARTSDPNFCGLGDLPSLSGHFHSIRATEAEAEANRRGGEGGREMAGRRMAMAAADSSGKRKKSRGDLVAARTAVARRPSIFSWLRAEELEVLMRGGATLDIAAMEAAAQYSDGFTRDHPVVRWFWQEARSLCPADQRRLLQFLTGSDLVPIRGLSDLKPPLSISRSGKDSCRLPAAHTCFNHLLLPEYGSREELAARLRLALQHAEGFGLF